jgi:hypothetical protein
MSIATQQRSSLSQEEIGPATLTTSVLWCLKASIVNLAQTGQKLPGPKS